MIFENIKEEKRNRIIKAALNEFALYGFENASTNRIVNTLNISKGSLFKYFSTKLGLYTYLVDIVLKRLQEALKQYEVKGDNWKEDLLNHVSLEIDFWISEPTMYRFFYKIAGELEQPQLEFIKNKMYKTSNLYLKKIFNSQNLSKESGELLMKHISFIKKGYNEEFLKLMENYKVSTIEKNKYISGFKKHLDLVRG